MVHERAIDTTRGPARYLEAGAGWPVVLIHAFPLSAEMWRPQLERVPEGWRFIAPHLRGLGPGAVPPGAPSMDDYAHDVESLLDALGVETAAIGGLSMGGYVTFALHRRAPGRFSAVILADTRAESDGPDARAARRAMSGLVQSKGPGAVADSMLPKLLSRAGREDPQIVARVRGMIEANTVEGIDAAVHGMMGRPDSTAQLAGMGIPALLIAGEEDELTPPGLSERMHNQMARSQLVVLPGAAHLSSLEAPGAFSTALADFLLAAI